jgi:hypothetical protein
MLQDLQLVNEAVVPIHPLAADPYNILSQTPEDSKWFSLGLKGHFLYHPSAPRLPIPLCF